MSDPCHAYQNPLPVVECAGASADLEKKKFQIWKRVYVFFLHFVQFE